MSFRMAAAVAPASVGAMPPVEAFLRALVLICTATHGCQDCTANSIVSP